MVDHIISDSRQEFVLILGMHRSGTSALARVLNLAGLCLPKNLLEPNQDNPLGYWEPKNTVKTNNQLLQQIGRHWADPKPMPDGWVEQFLDCPQNSIVLEALNTEMTQSVDNGRGLVIKDPRLSRVMPVWHTALQQLGAEVVCLIACRNPMNVYHSLQARDRFERKHALELWLSYMLEAERVTRGMRRVVVHYDCLLTHWRRTLQTIREATNLAGLTISDVKEQRIDTFLNQDLRHHQLTLSELEGGGPLHAMVRAAYELYSRVDGLAATAAFDELNRQKKAYWCERSPGHGGSGIIYQMPGWYVEQSWEFIANNDYQKALGALDTAIEMAPDVARFHFIRGNVLERMGQAGAALEARRAAVQLDDKVPRFHRALCHSLNQLGMHEEAADAIGVLAHLEPSAATHHRHGNYLARVGRLSEAVVAQRKAIALDNSKRRFYICLANALDRLGQKKEACAALAETIGSEPPSADLYDQFGQLLAGLGNWQAATNALDKAVTLRCQLLGFRNGSAAGRATDTQANARSHLLPLIARLGARHWAADLMLQLRRSAFTQYDQTNVWPLGRTIQTRPFVPLVDSDAHNDATAPLLSIMIPVYGIENERWLQVCLDSVLAQDQGPDWAEIVIIDDASNDKTAQRMAKAHAPRVRYVQNQENLGLVGNHNHCISIARGTFVHILHQDDYVEQGFYAALLKPMQADKTLVAGFTHNRYIDAEGRCLSNSDPSRPPLGVLDKWHIRLSLDLRIQFPSLIVRRESYQNVGGFYPARRFSFDWDLWNRIAASGPIWYDPRPLANYRIHGSSASYGFSMKGRVVDLMQTVASMVQLLPYQLQRSTAEMGMYKFFLRYWGLTTKLPFKAIPPEQSELVDFLLSGWTNEQERNQLLALLHKFTN